MKRLFISFVLIVVLVQHMFSQTPAYDMSYYLAKSKTQYQTGVILFGGGSAMLLLGIITASASSNDYAISDASGFLILGGLTADLLSIPFFMSSSKNARTAAMLSVENQRILDPGQGIYSQFQPALKLTFTFR
ncbi:MAG: hypothetical protein MUE95_16120 [Cyclobacteriaceae bacterium]|jgi:hypothetical protein|nr:hypothetical protein [Cyclobacteriaceae bacterium]